MRFDFGAMRDRHLDEIYQQGRNLTNESSWTTMISALYAFPTDMIASQVKGYVREEVANVL